MNKKIIIVGVIILALLITIFLVMRSSSESGRDRPAAFFEMFSRQGSAGAESVIMGDTAIAFGELINKLKSGEVNFVWELWAMRGQCDEDMTPEACDQSIIQYLDSKYSSPEKEKLKDLFQKYFKYEAEMRDTQFSSDMDFENKYDLIRKKRRELLGAEDAQLVFGMEEAQVDFMSTSQKLIAASKNQSGDERVRQYEQLKRSTFGTYYDSVVKREDTYQNYETEMSLRETDLNKLSGADKSTRLRELQEKYFGKEAAARIAQAETEAAAEEKKLADYEAREKEFLAQNANMSASDKEQKLREIRIQMLGKEDSEAYERRRQFEQAVQEIK